MKYLLTAFSVLVFSSVVSAQTVDVNDVPTDGEESTTIEITKGKKAAKDKAAAQFEVVEGSASIEGEATATAKEAKAAFKKACDTWKKELKAEAKENGNTVMTSDCGKPECSGAAGSKICSSTATYKVKTKLD